MSEMRSAIKRASIGKIRLKSGDCFEKFFYFKNNFLAFKGHFPFYPLLPAFVQIIIAQNIIEEYEDKVLDLISVKRAKFIKEIKPEIEIRVTCTLKKPLAYLIIFLDGKEKLSSFIINMKHHN